MGGDVQGDVDQKITDSIVPGDRGGFPGTEAFAQDGAPSAHLGVLLVGGTGVGTESVALLGAITPP
jgi:hypothetical protein